MATERQRNLGLIRIDDPWAQPANPDGTLAVEAKLTPRGWIAPTNPQMFAPVSLKDNPLGRMFHRHQIDRAQYLAGCEYQQAVELSRKQSGSGQFQLRVDGGQIGQAVSDRQLFYADRARKCEQAVMSRCGSEGLHIAQAVLLENKTSERAARGLGAKLEREIRAWQWLFRKCLDAIAERLGHAGLRQKRSRQDPYRASAAECQDPALRRSFDKRSPSKG
jgi:hypothetical protein